MPYKRRGSFRRRSSLGGIVNSIKNVFNQAQSTGTTAVATNLIIANDAPVTANPNEVKNGCLIKAIWVSIDFCGLAATGVLQRTSMYMVKNPGNNLTLPGPFTVGSSNEKKYVFKMWTQMTMRNQDGNPPYHWEGWIKIPKRYQRFGTDDRLQLNTATDTAAGHLSTQVIYKWYT